MSTDYTFSHEIPLDKLFDGRLKQAGIVEVNKRVITKQRSLWDGEKKQPRDLS